MKKYTFDITHIVLVCIILAIAFTLSDITRRALKKYLQHSSAKLKVDPANYDVLKIFVSIFYYTIALIFIFHMLPGLEKIGTALLASAGVLSVIIGLAAQQAFGNVFSGLYIVVTKPYRVNDIIQLMSGQTGTVEDITLQNTVMRLPDSRRLIIPNSLLSKKAVITPALKMKKYAIRLK